LKLGFGGQVLGLLAGLTLAGSMVQAASIVGAGQFNLSGAVYVTQTSFQFGYNTAPPPGDQKASVVIPVSGQFTDLKAGQLAGVSNLFGPPTGPVTPGTPFSLPNWVTLPDNINLDLTSIPINMSVPVCSGTAADDTLVTGCRAYASSPIVLFHNPSGVNATLNLSGVAHFVGSTDTTPFVGLLSANFTFAPDNTIAGLLADFNAHGFITTGYAANFTTTATSPVPEPAALAPIGLGLLGMGLARRKKAQKVS
jgi:hypothetical protein